MWAWRHVCCCVVCRVHVCICGSIHRRRQNLSILRRAALRKFVPGQGWNHVVPPVRQGRRQKEHHQNPQTPLFFFSSLLLSSRFPSWFFFSSHPGPFVPAGWVHRSHRHVASGAHGFRAGAGLEPWNVAAGPPRGHGLGSTDTLTLCGQKFKLSHGLPIWNMT